MSSLENWLVEEAYDFLTKDAGADLEQLSTRELAAVYRQAKSKEALSISGGKQLVRKGVNKVRGAIPGANQAAKPAPVRGTKLDLSQQQNQVGNLSEQQLKQLQNPFRLGTGKQMRQLGRNPDTIAGRSGYRRATNWVGSFAPVSSRLRMRRVVKKELQRRKSLARSQSALPGAAEGTTRHSNIQKNIQKQQQPQAAQLAWW